MVLRGAQGGACVASHCAAGGVVVRSMMYLMQVVVL